MIIDRFEGEYAVVELDDSTFVNIPKRILPNNAKEGDFITIGIDKEKTKNKAKEIDNRLKGLFVD